MPAATRNETHDIKNPHAQAATHPVDEHDDDPTTLKFNGPVAVADEDVGSDPYNRTGRFRRLVRS